MNPYSNPFSPGAGTPPPELAGRESILEKADLLLARVKNGRSEKSFLMIGLRGVGKTVLLNSLKQHAETQGYRCILVECHEGKSLAALLAPALRQLLFSLDHMENISKKTRRALAVLKSFLTGIKIVINDIEFGIEGEKGAADSGDIEADLPELLTAVAEAAKDRKTSVAILIDELQYLSANEFSALIMSIHRISQQGLPLVLVGAGLPQLPAIAGDSKSYAERLFDFPDIGPLDPVDARRALTEPLLKVGVRFTVDALEEILIMTKGYPYFLQEWGYHSWNISQASPIDLATVKAATDTAIKRLDKAFFRVRFDRLTPREREYLRALAELGPGSHRSGDIANILKVAVSRLGPIRDGLIKKGMIYSPAYGDTAFTVPLFDQFMIRVMAERPKPWGGKKGS